MPKIGKNERIKRQYMSLDSDRKRLLFLEDLAVMRRSNMLSDQELSEFEACVKDYFSPVGADGRRSQTVFDLRMSAYQARKLELQTQAGKTFLDMKSNYPQYSDEKLREAVSYTDQSMERSRALDTYVMNFDLIDDEYKKGYIEGLSINAGEGREGLNRAFLEGYQRRYDSYVSFLDEEDEDAIDEGENVINQSLDGESYLEKAGFTPVRAQHLGDLGRTAAEGKSFRDPAAFINMEKLRELDSLYTELVAADRRMHINSGRYNDLVRSLEKVHRVYNTFKDQGVGPDPQDAENILSTMDELQDVNETYLESKRILKNPDELLENKS